MGQTYLVRHNQGAAYQLTQEELDKLTATQPAGYEYKKDAQESWQPLGPSLVSAADSVNAPVRTVALSTHSRMTWLSGLKVLFVAAFIVGLLERYYNNAWQVHTDAEKNLVRIHPVTGTTQFLRYGMWQTSSQYAEELKRQRLDQYQVEPPVVVTYGPIQSETDKNGLVRKFRSAFHVTNTTDKHIHGLRLACPTTTFRTSTLFPHQETVLYAKVYVGETVELTAYSFQRPISVTVQDDPPTSQR